MASVRFSGATSARPSTPRTQPLVAQPGPVRRMVGPDAGGSAMKRMSSFVGSLKVVRAGTRRRSQNYDPALAKYPLSMVGPRHRRRTRRERRSLRESTSLLLRRLSSDIVSGLTGVSGESDQINILDNSSRWSSLSDFNSGNVSHRSSFADVSEASNIYRMKAGPRLDPPSQSSVSSPRGRNEFTHGGSGMRNRLSFDCPPIAPLKPTPPVKEARFLEAAQRGDKASLENFIANGININCCDVLGRTALEIAVDNENLEIVEILLQEPGIKIGHALLYAIREGVYRMVEMMIDHESIKSRSPDVLADGWRKTLDRDAAMNFEYSADITPVMLAAHLNQFEILKLLKDRGAMIEKPHSLSCPCSTCEEDRIYDNLRHSLRRIHAYRALASPAWISLTSADPILDAFKLSYEVQRLAFSEWEFRDVYLRLAEQCKLFACDLLSQCRSTEEVIAVLNKDNFDEADEPVNLGSKLTLARLKLAIKFEQKSFVAHPHCQQLLTSIWYEGFPGRQERGSFTNVLLCTLLIAVWPLLAVVYIVAPKSRLGQIVRSPFMKFLYYSVSFGSFLLLLVLSALLEDRGHDSREMQRGPYPSTIEGLVFCWVLGMTWAEVKQVWDEGFKRYILQWWNWLDFMMMTLYLCAFSVRFVAIYLDHRGLMTPMSRNHWVSNEPLLVFEALFAMGNVISFARIVYLFQTNPYLGPLQISLGCMLVDIAKFIFIFFLILTSFAFGLHQLYWYYTPTSSCFDERDSCNTGAFATVESSYLTLLWSLFSITSTKDTNVKEPHHLTMWIGRGLYIAYHVTSIIVLLNMLIAMMSFSFQRINENADLEWKFHRSKLWMSYFDEGSSLPAPFNIVITPKALYKFLRMIALQTKSFCTQNRVIQHLNSSNKRGTIRRPGYNREKWQRVKQRRPISMDEDKPTYREIMERLVHRYIHMIKKDLKMDGVNEDDLLEIKQDISSLRYELREDRRREVLRFSQSLDTAKREIIRTLSIVPRLRVSPASTAPASDAPSKTSTVSEGGGGRLRLRRKRDSDADQEPPPPPQEEPRLMPLKRISQSLRYSQPPTSLKSRDTHSTTPETSSTRTAPSIADGSAASEPARPPKQKLASRSVSFKDTKVDVRRFYCGDDETPEERAAPAPSNTEGHPSLRHPLPTLKSVDDCALEMSPPTSTDDLSEDVEHPMSSSTSRRASVTSEVMRKDVLDSIKADIAHVFENYIQQMQDQFEDEMLPDDDGDSL